MPIKYYINVVRISNKDFLQEILTSHFNGDCIISVSYNLLKIDTLFISGKIF